jgi:hypothetical protein
MEALFLEGVVQRIQIMINSTSYITKDNLGNITSGLGMSAVVTAKQR